MFFKILFFCAFFCCSPSHASTSPVLSKAEIKTVIRTLSNTDQKVYNFVNTQTPEGFETFIACLQDISTCERIDILTMYAQSFKKAHHSSRLKEVDSDYFLSYCSTQKELHKKKDILQQKTEALQHAISSFKNALHIQGIPEKERNKKTLHQFIGKFYDQHTVPHLNKEFLAMHSKNFDYLYNLFVKMVKTQEGTAHTS